MGENIEKYLNRVAEAAEQNALVKMTLSKPADKHDELRNIYVKPVLIKGNASSPSLIVMSVATRLRTMTLSR